MLPAHAACRYSSRSAMAQELGRICSDTLRVCCASVPVSRHPYLSPWPSYSINNEGYLPAGRKKPKAERILSLKQEEEAPVDACCSISLAAPECAPSAPTSSGEEPVQSYRFKSRRGYSLQVKSISGTHERFHRHSLTIHTPGRSMYALTRTVRCTQFCAVMPCTAGGAAICFAARAAKARAAGAQGPIRSTLGHGPT